MPELSTPAEAVYEAFYASFDCPHSEVLNPDRRGLDTSRFHRELSQIGWWVEVEPAKAGPDHPAYLNAVLEDADEAAFGEGQVDGDGYGALNSWSADGFVASCERDGVTFVRMPW